MMRFGNLSPASTSDREFRNPISRDLGIIDPPHQCMCCFTVFGRCVVLPTATIDGKHLSICTRCNTPFVLHRSDYETFKITQDDVSKYHYMIFGEMHNPKSAGKTVIIYSGTKDDATYTVRAIIPPLEYMQFIEAYGFVVTTTKLRRRPKQFQQRAPRVVTVTSQITDRDYGFPSFYNKMKVSVSVNCMNEIRSWLSETNKSRA